MRVETTSSVREDLLQAARAAHPFECCGILLGEVRADGIRIVQAVAARNVDPEPHRRFAIDPATLIGAHRAARDGGRAVVGYYHSHPKGSATPSVTDRAEAAGDGKIWAIVAGEDIGWWRDAMGGFEPVTSYWLA